MNGRVETSLNARLGSPSVGPWSSPPSLPLKSNIGLAWARGDGSYNASEEIRTGCARGIEIRGNSVILVSLFALSFWSFHFASLCAFGLLAYVGFIVYAFPSLFRLHRLNGLLLVFILLWAVSAYIFNVAFAFLNRKLGKAVLSLIAIEEETKVLIVATIAWGLHKSSQAIMLSLIFLIAMKPGFIHAVYKRRIASFLSEIGQKFLCMYRSCGTYIAFITILLTVYLVRLNHISFGYIFLLLVWIIVRQLVERTKGSYGFQ